MNAPTQIGFFGKIPSHGDFVRRRFPLDLSRSWDDWLQTGLAASREQLGDDWLRCYLSGPIWRFCLSAGLCGGAQWIGAMMPSVDRVGRYFPLTAVSTIPPGQDLFGAAAAASPWFDELEGVMLGALEGDAVSADELSARLDQISRLVHEAPAVRASEPAMSGSDEQVIVSLSDAARFHEATNALASGLARRLWDNGFSVWWSNGSEFVEPDARVYGGLPSAAAFQTLYSRTHSR